MKIIEEVKDYIAQKLGDSDQVEIDFADICTENDVIEAAEELGLAAEKSTGQGVWWIYKEEPSQ